MERRKTGKPSGGNQNCKNLILLTKIKLENNFLYLPLWLSRVKFLWSNFLSRLGLKLIKISSYYLNQNKSYNKMLKNYTVKKNLNFFFSSLRNDVKPIF